VAEHDDLEDRKARISKKYLGVAGIHAVGVSRSRSKLNVYVERRSPALDNVLNAIEQDAAPFGIAVIESERASTHDE
jgi:hypothetical protein